MGILNKSLNAKIMLLKALENDGIYPSEGQKLDLLLLNLKALNEEVNSFDDTLGAFILKPLEGTKTL